MFRLVALFVLLATSLLAQSAPVTLPDKSTVQDVFQVHDKIIFVPKMSAIPPAHRAEVQALYDVEKRWAKVFYLEDWKVAVFQVPLKQLQMFCFPVHCLAASDWDVNRQTGVILIPQASDYTEEMKQLAANEGRTVLGDQRNSVVHEMLHNAVEHMDEEKLVSILAHWLQK